MCGTWDKEKEIMKSKSHHSEFPIPIHDFFPGWGLSLSPVLFLWDRQVLRRWGYDPFPKLSPDSDDRGQARWMGRLILF